MLHVVESAGCVARATLRDTVNPFGQRVKRTGADLTARVAVNVERTVMLGNRSGKADGARSGKAVRGLLRSYPNDAAVTLHVPSALVTDVTDQVTPPP